MITDDDIIEMIKSNQLNGVSPNFRLHANKTCLKEIEDVEGNLFYNKDIENKECMNPVFLSLVDEPANEYGLEVYSYDKYLEKSKKRGSNMVNKFKEMLRGFGESIVNYSEEMPELEKADNSTEQEAPADSASTETDSSSEESASTEEEVLSGENSFESIKRKVGDAVQTQYFPEDEKGNKTYIDVALTFSNAVVVQDWENDKYYRTDYTIDGDNVTLGKLKEVKLEEVVTDVGSESAPAEEAPAESEKSVESQKSKQPKIKMPKIRVNETKLDDTELEKGNQERTNHLGFPIKSTKELAKSSNSFNF